MDLIDIYKATPPNDRVHILSKGTTRHSKCRATDRISIHLKGVKFLH